MFILILSSGTGRAVCTDGLEGWYVLSEQYQQEVPKFMDGITFQWDYFMVHDAAFTGSVGYVVADPRERLVGLMPSGGNAAIAGKFIATGQIIADYMNFGTGAWASPGSKGYMAKADIREFHAEKDPYYAHIIPVRETETLILRGHTQKFEWDLAVTQDWSERCDPDYVNTFPVVTGYDLGFFPLLHLQHWSVDMNWLRTRVKGYIKNLTTNPPETIPIDGHGYREQAWGPWAFNFSGWDFAVVSNSTSQVQWALQTYHDSETLDYLDVSFFDNGLKVVRFKTENGELGWYHTAWKFDRDARQCVPTDMTVVAQNKDYIVEASVAIGDDQVPMLSDLTPVTSQYVIVCRFPQIWGTIKRRSTGDTVASFSGQGGGEFSIPRRPEGEVLSDAECGIWGRRFSAPLPLGY
jgi:hypothetical protein